MSAAFVKLFQQSTGNFNPAYKLSAAHYAGPAE
jgi:hypothetical protein